MGQVIQIDEARIQDHLGEMVRGTVEETLNALLDAVAAFAGALLIGAAICGLKLRGIVKKQYELA